MVSCDTVFVGQSLTIFGPSHRVSYRAIRVSIFPDESFCAVEMYRNTNVCIGRHGGVWVRLSSVNMRIETDHFKDVWADHQGDKWVRIGYVDTHTAYCFRSDFQHAEAPKEGPKEPVKTAEKKGKSKRSAERTVKLDKGRQILKKVKKKA